MSDKCQTAKKPFFSFDGMIVWSWSRSGNRTRLWGSHVYDNLRDLVWKD